MCAHDSSSYRRGARVVVSHSISAGEVPKRRVSLRRRQMLERTKVAQQRAEDCGKGCRALRHAIRQVTKATTFFIEPSDFSLHQIKRIYGSGARPSVAAMVGAET